MPQKRIYMTVPRGLAGKGGIERQCQYTLAHWAETVPDLAIVPLVTRGDDGHRQWPFVYLGACARLAYACAVRRDVGVLHLNAAVRASLWRKAGLALIARAFGVPTVLHLHGGGFDQALGKMRPVGQKLTRWLFRGTGTCLVLGQYWADFIIRTFDLDPARVRILMNAVPAPQVTTPPDFSIRPQHILFLGEVGPRKGVHILVEALGRLKHRQDWHCTIAGNGPDAAYHQQAAQLGIADRIQFPGWQSPEATTALLASAQILVLPSFAENLPMAVLEGLAQGLVVIATPVGAIPEVIADGQNGYLVPVGDAGAIADVLGRVLDDPVAAQRCSTAAVATFRERLSLTPYCKALAAVYREVMRQNG